VNIWMESVLIHFEDHVGRAWESKRPSFGGLLLKMFHVEDSSIGIGVDPWVCASRLGLERASMRFPQTTRRAKKKSFCLFESKMCREFLDRTRILKSKGWCLRGFFLKMFHVEHLKIAGRWEYLNGERADSFWGSCW